MTARNTLDDNPTDETLLAAVRAGDLGAFAELFRRHAESTRRAARAYADGSSEQQDLVAEAFARVLLAIRRGRGPRANLRPYLFVTIRNLANRWRFGQRHIDRYREVGELDEVAQPV